MKNRRVKTRVSGLAVHGLLVLAATLAGCEPRERTEPADDVPTASSAMFRLADAPMVTIGVTGGQEEQELFEVSGAARLADGSIVVYESGAFRLQKFGPAGEHLWSRGQPGEGPGDFANFAQLLVPCASEQSILVYDRYNRRITAFDGDGALLRTFPLAFQESSPYDISCAPGGRLVFSGWAHEQPSEPGPYRTTADMAFADGSEVTLLREGILAEARLATANSEGRLTGSAPGIWSRSLRFAATDEGVWLGTGDDYEMELLDWTGATARTLRWEGPDLAVTQMHIDGYREAVRDSFASGLDFWARTYPDVVAGSDWQQRFEARWERDQEVLPPAFPAYDRVLLGDDGVLWIEDFPRPGEPSAWFVLDEEGERVRSLTVPPGITLLDIGADWVLVTYRDAMDVEMVASYSLVEN